MSIRRTTRLGPTVSSNPAPRSFLPLPALPCPALPYPALPCPAPRGRAAPHALPRARCLARRARVALLAARCPARRALPCCRTCCVAARAALLAARCPTRHGRALPYCLHCPAHRGRALPRRALPCSQRASLLAAALPARCLCRAQLPCPARARDLYPVRLPCPALLPCTRTCTALPACVSPAPCACPAPRCCPTRTIFLPCPRAVSSHGVSLFKHTSGSLQALKALAEPAAAAGEEVQMQYHADHIAYKRWRVRDAGAKLAVCTHLSLDQRDNFRQVPSAHALYTAVVSRYSPPVSCHPRPSCAAASLPCASLFVLPLPPPSSLLTVPDPVSDFARAASPIIPYCLATLVAALAISTAVASALVAQLAGFATTCRRAYLAGLVSASLCPPSVGGELALGCDVREDRQFDLEYLPYPLSIRTCYVALGRHHPAHWRAARRVLRYLVRLASRT
ncbi:unnamed protein product [Closterium sp. NIES-53]